MTAIPILFIRLYQRWVSPLFGANCRFGPSCSDYGIKALQKHGLVGGLPLLLWRLIRCSPWGGAGHDPVPERAWSFVALRHKNTDRRAD